MDMNHEHPDVSVMLFFNSSHVLFLLKSDAKLMWILSIRGKLMKTS